jgi:hypothetical protein
MNVLDFHTKEPNVPALVGGIIPLTKMTLFHGAQGSGKTYSLIAMLNNEGVIPYYIDLDHTTGIDKLFIYRLQKELLLSMLAGEEIQGLKGKVVIIDTYTRIHEELEAQGLTMQQISDNLEALVTKYEITLIVIGHTRLFASKDGIFSDNPILARNSAEELFLEKVVYKKTKSNPAHIEYTLHICKGRGNGGAKIIPMWMRGSFAVSPKIPTDELQHLEEAINKLSN